MCMRLTYKVDDDILSLLLPEAVVVHGLPEGVAFVHLPAVRGSMKKLGFSMHYTIYIHGHHQIIVEIAWQGDM